jgi:hypothetical protein
LPKIPDDVVETESIVKRSRATRPRANPCKVRRFHGKKIVRGKSPILTVGRIRVRRRAKRDVKLELSGVRPDVRAFRSDDEGQVAHELDTKVAHPTVSFLPLPKEQPLQVRDFDQTARVILACLLDRLRVAIAKVFGPSRPAPAALCLTERRIKGEIVEPRLFADDELGEFLGAWRALGPLAFEEMIERDPRHLQLERANKAVLDVFCPLRLR